MAEPDAKPETPDAFLKGAAANLQAAKGVDTDLAKILATEILVVKPLADAVNRAKAAIIALAEKRAAPSEATDG
jgi:hypothetical protein